MSLAGEKSKKIDLAGRSLVPGFVDSRLHTAVLGANTIAIDCKYPQVKSIKEIQKLVAEAVKKAPTGAWIRGWGYDHS